MYKLVINTLSGGLETVVRTTDGARIPFDPDNTDYQAYLEWVAAGNTPEPAEDA